MEQGGGGIWRWILEHPTLAGLMASASFAATFAPKVSGRAAWICIVVSSMFWASLVLGVAQKKQWRWPTTSVVVLLGLVGLLSYGRWLTTKESRAHIHITQFNFLAPGAVGGTASVRITFVSNGDLPIKKLKGYGRLAFYALTGNRSDQVSFEDSLFANEPKFKAEELPDNETPVGVDRSVTVSSDIKWGEEAIEKFKDKHIFIYVVGGLVYSDGNSTWTTKYCTYVQSDGQNFFCGKGNEEP